MRVFILSRGEVVVPIKKLIRRLGFALLKRQVGGRGGGVDVGGLLT